MKVCSLRKVWIYLGSITWQGKEAGEHNSLTRADIQLPAVLQDIFGIHTDSCYQALGARSELLHLGGLGNLNKPSESECVGTSVCFKHSQFISAVCG